MRFWIYIGFFARDAIIWLIWVIVFAAIALLALWLLGQLMNLIKQWQLDRVQVEAAWQAMELDRIERKVRIAVAAHPYTGEIREIEALLDRLFEEKAQLELPNDEQKLTLASRAGLIVEKAEKLKRRAEALAVEVVRL